MSASRHDETKETDPIPNNDNGGPKGTFLDELQRQIMLRHRQLEALLNAWAEEFVGEVEPKSNLARKKLITQLEALRDEWKQSLPEWSQGLAKVVEAPAAAVAAAIVTQPQNIAEMTAVILSDHAELSLQEIQGELLRRYNITVEKKILRTILDRWLEGKIERAKFKRTKPSTYALLNRRPKSV